MDNKTDEHLPPLLLELLQSSLELCHCCGDWLMMNKIKNISSVESHKDPVSYPVCFVRLLIISRCATRCVVSTLETQNPLKQWGKNPRTSLPPRMIAQVLFQMSPKSCGLFQ